MRWSTIGGAAGGLLGGGLGALTGNPALAFGGASLGSGLGTAIGSEFDPHNPTLRVGGLSDEQIAQLVAAERARGTAAVEAARRGAYTGVSTTAGAHGLAGSGLAERGRRFADEAAAQSQAEVEAGAAGLMGQLYGQQRWAPPQPNFAERVSPMLTGIGANLIGSAAAPKAAATTQSLTGAAAPSVAPPTDAAFGGPTAGSLYDPNRWRLRLGSVSYPPATFE